MCDYSIHAERTTNAQYNDALESRVLGHSVGFSTVLDKGCAVCLQPGTEIAFEDNVKYGRFMFIFPHKTKSKVAIFRKVDVGQEFKHHDALEFGDGTTILLNDLWEGQRARVLQLPCGDKVPPPKVVTLVRSPLFEYGI